MKKVVNLIKKKYKMGYIAGGSYRPKRKRLAKKILQFHVQTGWKSYNWYLEAHYLFKKWPWWYPLDPRWRKTKCSYCGDRIYHEYCNDGYLKFLCGSCWMYLKEEKAIYYLGDGTGIKINMKIYVKLVKKKDEYLRERFKRGINCRS